MTNSKIEIESIISADIDKVWKYWTEPEHITKWNFASDDWCCPNAENDLRVGGRFTSRMEAKDGSFGFDFGGTYNEVIDKEKISYVMDDGRAAITNFERQGDKIKVTTLFDPETENPVEMQKEGWQAILDNFKKHVEEN